MLCVFAESELGVIEIPGIEGWGSIFADGRTLVIGKGKNFDPLVLYDIESQRLVLKGRVVQHPRLDLDPSGRKIVFSSEKPYAGLWIVGTDVKGLNDGQAVIGWPMVWSDNKYCRITLNEKTWFNHQAAESA